MNGVESEVGKVLEHAERRGVSVRDVVNEGRNGGEANVEIKKEDESDGEADEGVDTTPDEGSGRESTPASSTRSKVRQRKKA